MLKAEIEKIAVSFNKGTPLPIRPELDWCRNPITGEYAERLLTAGYLRHPDFAGEPIDDDRHAVARVVDEQSLPRRMRLPHRRRQRLLERAIDACSPARHKAPPPVRPRSTPRRPAMTGRTSTAASASP